MSKPEMKVFGFCMVLSPHIYRFLHGFKSTPLLGPNLDRKKETDGNPSQCNTSLCLEMSCGSLLTTDSVVNTA